MQSVALVSVHMIPDLFSRESFERLQIAFLCSLEDPFFVLLRLHRMVSKF